MINHNHRIHFCSIVFLLVNSMLTSHLFAQNKWEFEEETNLVGSISGTIQQGHIFKTSSGSIYEVTGLTLQLVLELSPNVIVLRNGDIYKLIIEGFDESLICSQLKPANLKQQYTQNKEVIESRIDGNFEGWEGETIFKLENGQIWQQSSYSYLYKYKFRPKMLIYPSRRKYILKVEGVSKTISVIRLK